MKEVQFTRLQKARAEQAQTFQELKKIVKEQIEHRSGETYDYIDAKAACIRLKEKFSLSIRAVPDRLDNILDWLVEADILLQSRQIKWSKKPMSKAEIASKLEIDSPYKFNQCIEAGIYTLRQVGKNRQAWQIRLNDLTEKQRAKFE